MFNIKNGSLSLPFLIEIKVNFLRISNISLYFILKGFLTSMQFFHEYQVVELEHLP